MESLGRDTQIFKRVFSTPMNTSVKFLCRTGAPEMNYLKENGGDIVSTESWQKHCLVRLYQYCLNLVMSQSHSEIRADGEGSP